MDSDIKHIIEEEKGLVQLAEDSAKASGERVEQYRIRAARLRESEFIRIAAEFSDMFDEKMREIKNRTENDLREMRISQEKILSEADLKNKITGRIVSLILENRT